MWTKAVLWVLVAGCGKKGADTPAPEPAPAPAAPAPAPEPEPAPAPLEDPVARPEPGQAGAMCGGIAALACAAGMACVDDPTDGCDPLQGGRDCSGKCVPCDAPELDRKVVSDNPQQCAAIRFRCAEGEQAWFDNCGCGCVKKP